MDNQLPPVGAWFSPEEVKRHAEGVIMGAAGILGLQKLGLFVTGEKAKLQEDLAREEEKNLHLTADLKDEREKTVDLRKTVTSLQQEVATLNERISQLRRDDR